jgi:DNA-binding NarL/FixJ family response regulator
LKHNDMKDSDRNQAETSNRILIVDDHPLVRESLRRLVQQEPDLVVCGEAEDREQALVLVAELQPHLVTLDLSLKNSHGTELIRTLRDQYPKVFVLVLSMHDELVYAERAIRAGAHGYVAKHEALSKIRAAIRCVLAGEIYWSEKAAVRVASKFACAPSPSRSSANQTTDILTDREMQVFELIGTGRSTRQIAAALHIDMSTVETYRSRIKDKLKLKSAAELLQHAIRWANDLKG